MLANTAGADLNPIFFCAPARIMFGVGVRTELPPLLAQLGYQRAAIITDRFFSAPGRAASELADGLKRVGISSVMFDGGLPDPSLELCDRASAHLREQGAVDCVIAVGGGSNIDLAKVMTLTLTSPQPAAHYVGKPKLDTKPLPLIAMPTTAGTASEITPGAILVSGDGQTKVAVMDNELRARIAVIDPELTLSCPPRVTADAGVDALTHAIESFITMDASDFNREGQADPGYSGRNALTRIFAQEAIRLCFAHLERAYRHPDDIQARTGMALASLYAGMSYGNAGLHAVHALAYGVAALTHESHGTTNAVMLPYVMAELAADRMEDLCEIARMANVYHEPHSSLKGALSGAHHVRDLIRSLGIATRLDELGITAQDLDRVAAAGVAVSRLTKAFPGGEAERRYQEIVHCAFRGALQLPDA